MRESGVGFQGEQDKLIESKPKLRYIFKSLELLRPEGGPTGEERNWKELHREVKPWNNAVELSDNVRDVVRDYVAQKIPKLKERVPSIAELPDEALLDALTNNWFEAVEPGDEDEPGISDNQRSYVLLTVMAHVVKRVENAAYRKILETAMPEDFKKLGLDEDYRRLLVDSMDISAKADPLYARFLAYSQLSGEPPLKASETALFLPGDRKPHTLREMFPHETQFLSKRLGKLVEDSSKWEGKPGGKVFREYLETLSAAFGETEPKKAAELQKRVKELYNQAIAAGFPVIVTPPLDTGSVKEPYLDPELKVSIAAPEATAEDRQFTSARDAMAEGLAELGVEEKWRDNVKKQKVKSSIVLGGYGVNLNLSAVASESGGVSQLFYNEQLRTYDREFPSFLNNSIANTDAIFRGSPTAEKQALMERQSRTNTILHEFSHPVYDEDSKEFKRLGRKPGTIIDEAKAEALFPALVPKMIEKGALPGTREQWAVGILGSKMQMLRDQPEGDEYYHAAVYSLNRLFKDQAVTLDGEKVKILDFDKFYKSQGQAAREILALYQDTTMTEARAREWATDNCEASRQVRRLKKLLEEQDE